MNTRFTGQHVLVTGAGSGIGREMPQQQPSLSQNPGRSRAGTAEVRLESRPG